MRSSRTLACLFAAACSSSQAPADHADATAAALDAASGPDAPLPALVACPADRITALGACYTVVPSDVGADPSGENAGSASVALTPSAGVAARDQLVVYINGTDGHPTEVASATTNFYNSATALGYHVLAISYRSDEEITQKICDGVDACLFPSRETLILGALQPGAGSDVADIRLSEGITDRLFLTLRYLAAADPSGGWAQFLTGHDGSAVPDTQIAWPKLVLAGHSQGGGHAAAVAKLFPVARVVQLASTCDVSGTARNLNDVVAATWTDGGDGAWATDPRGFYGLVDQTTFDGSGNPIGGDLQCFTTELVWPNLGMMAARQHTDAATCGKDAHEATWSCVDNAPTWTAMLQ